MRIMRFTFFFAALLVGVVHGHVLRFQPHTTMTYEYDGYMFTTLAKKAPMKVGIGFKCLVNITHMHGNDFVIKIKDFKSSKANDIAEKFPDILPNPEPLPPKVKEHLERPFFVNMAQGKINGHRVDPTEPEWIVNIKRGLMNFFHLNITTVEGVRNPSVGDTQLRFRYGRYTAMEDGLNGNCETTYHIEVLEPWHHLLPGIDRSRHLNVTKVRNYDRCIDAPFRFYTDTHGHVCAECEADKSHPLHNGAVYRYNLTTDNYRFRIDQAYTEDIAIFNPNTIEGEWAKVYSVRKLKFIKEEVVNEANEIPRNYVFHNKITFHFPGGNKNFYGDVNMFKPHYLYYFLGTTLTVDQIMKMFDEVIRFYKDINIPRGDLPSPGRKFVELARGFSTLDYDTIDKVYQKVIQNPEKKYERLFFDVLGAAGTNPAFTYGSFLIKHNRVKENATQVFLQRQALHVKEPSAVLFQDFFNLCKHPSVIGNKHVYRTCLLSFSSLLHRTCMDKKDEGLPRSSGTIYCSEKEVEKYTHYFRIPETPGTQDDCYKLMLIRVLENLGTKNIIPLLKPFIYKEKPMSTQLRAASVWALGRVTTHHPKEVMDTLMPIFADWDDDHEVRIAAFTIIMRCHPPLSQLEGMVKMVYREKNRQMVSWVYSSLKSLASSNYPCHRKCAKDAEFALRILDKYVKVYGDFDMRDSTNFMSAGYDSQYDLGGFTNIAFIASNTSYVPRSFYFSLHDYAFGKTYDTLSFGFQARGWQRELDKFMGPNVTSTVYDPNQLQAAKKEFRDLDDALHVQEREHEPSFTHMFMSVFGQSLDFYYSNKSLSEVIRELLYDKPVNVKNEDGHNFMLLEDNLLLFPTEFGLPVAIDLKMPLYVNYHIKERGFAIKPNDFMKQGRIDSIDYFMDGTIGYDRDHYTELAIIYPGTQKIGGSGVQNRNAVSLPIKMNFHWDVAKRQMKYRMKPINHNIYFHKIQPYSCFHYYNASTNELRRDDCKLMYKGESLKFENDYLHKRLGFGINVKTHVEEYSHRYTDNAKFDEEKTWRDKIYYYFNQPDSHAHEWNISLTKAKEHATDEILVETEYDMLDLENLPEECKREGVEDGLSHISKMNTKIIGSGQLERKILTDMYYVHRTNNLFHCLKMNYDRTPLPPKESSNFVMQLLGTMKYPKLDFTQMAGVATEFSKDDWLKVLRSNFRDLDQIVKGKLRINFSGGETQDPKTIVVDAQWDKTEEQIKMNEERDQPVTYKNHNPFAYYFQRCVKDVENNVRYSPYCKKYILMSTELRKASFEIAYTGLGDYFLNTTYILDDYLKHVYFHYMDNNALETNPSGTVRISANMTVHEPIKADVRMYKPRETTFFNNIPVVYSQPMPTYSRFQDSRIEQLFSVFSHRHYCSFEKSFIRTFNNVSFSVGPWEECETVVTKDCSPSKEFALYSKKVANPKFPRSMKLFLGKHKIEIRPKAESGRLVVLIDGVETPIPQEGFYKFIIEDAHKTELFRILFDGAGYVVRSDRFGVDVLFDGTAIKTQVSTYYVGRLCGVCGTFNLIRENELMGPNQCAYRDPIAFGYAYTLPADDGKCVVPKLQDRCLTEAARGCLYMRNRYVYLGGRNRQVCFTTEPLPECAEGCEAQGTLNRRVGFHCLAARDDFTKYLQRESERRVLHEVARKTEDHFEEVEYPETCRRLNQ